MSLSSPNQDEIANGLSQIIDPKFIDFMDFYEQLAFGLHFANFVNFFAIGSEFASRTRSRYGTPFPAVSAKIAVLENVVCQNLQKISEKVGTFFLRKSVKGIFANFGDQFHPFVRSGSSRPIRRQHLFKFIDN